MAHFTLKIEDDGPLLNVQLSVSAPRATALTEAQRPVPEPFAAKGLVDTGASCTSVDPSVVAALGLSPVGEMRVVTPSTGGEAVAVYQYDVGLAIFSSLDDAPLAIPALPVAEFPLLNQGFHALLGRDILSRCVLVYNGSTDLFTLAF